MAQTTNPASLVNILQKLALTTMLLKVGCVLLSSLALVTLSHSILSQLWNNYKSKYSKLALPKKGDLYTVTVYVPISHADTVRKAMSIAKAGYLHGDNYDSASFSVKGVGRFRPLENATPTIGCVGALVEVDEEMIQVS